MVAQQRTELHSTYATSDLDSNLYNVVDEEMKMLKNVIQDNQFTLSEIQSTAPPVTKNSVQNPAPRNLEDFRQFAENFRRIQSTNVDSNTYRNQMGALFDSFVENEYVQNGTCKKQLTYYIRDGNLSQFDIDLFWKSYEKIKKRRQRQSLRVSPTPPL